MIDTDMNNNTPEKSEKENELIFNDRHSKISTNEAIVFLDSAIEFQKLMTKYSCAIREVKTKLAVLNDDLSIKNSRSPIESITSRIKKPASIMRKLNEREYDLTIPSIQNNLNDIAGVRVVCSFIDDIYSIAEMLAYQDDITVIEIKDYIKNPKSNGYRSYHMIVEIPVFFSDKKESMRVEIQIRTIAMDFWASLDHRLKYKQSVKNENEIVARLTKCADIISEIDKEMQDIRREIEENSTDKEITLFDKFEKISFGTENKID